MRCKREFVWTARLLCTTSRIHLLWTIRPIWLQTLPGVGFILAKVILLEIGDIDRFSTTTQLAVYAGSTPRVHSLVTRLNMEKYILISIGIWNGPILKRSLAILQSLRIGSWRKGKNIENHLKDRFRPRKDKCSSSLSSYLRNWLRYPSRRFICHLNKEDMRQVRADWGWG